MNESALRESFGRIKEDIERLRAEITELRQENAALREQIKDVGRTPVQVQPAPALEQEVAKKLNRNKKGIIKQKILELLDQGIPVIEVKDRIVDQQKYCAKASFYRYVEELKKDGKFIEVTR